MFSVHGGHYLLPSGDISSILYGGGPFPTCPGVFPHAPALVAPSHGFLGLLLHSSLAHKEHQSSSSSDATRSFLHPGHGPLFALTIPSSSSSLAPPLSSMTKVFKLNIIKDAKDYQSLTPAPASHSPGVCVASSATPTVSGSTGSGMAPSGLTVALSITSDVADYFNSYNSFQRAGNESTVDYADHLNLTSPLPHTLLLADPWQFPLLQSPPQWLFPWSLPTWRWSIQPLLHPSLRAVTPSTSCVSSVA